MTIDASQSPPSWDTAQLEIVLEDPKVWQLVVAGPGSGKTAVACQRVAYLVDEGLSAPRILLVSFTRTAVAELRDRIVSYAIAGDRVRSVRISTIDSHAWSLRVGFDDGEAKDAFGGSFDLNIQRVIELFQEGDPDLLDFMERLEHLIIDEAQDVIGARAELVTAMLRSLSEDCGVTIFADPAQAIYGFTTDDESLASDRGLSLLDRLLSESPRTFAYRELEKVHRSSEPQLIELFRRTRSEVQAVTDKSGYVERIQGAIKDTSHEDKGTVRAEALPALLRAVDEGSTLVLFRRRADVLIASSYCSNEGLSHRLRLSGLPTPVRPWIGWLFAEAPHVLLSRPDFQVLWGERFGLAPHVFEGVHEDEAWDLLHRLSAGNRPATLDLVQLRRLVARSRPPVEICYPELGSKGPILGTIHASKGREADKVVLVLPAGANDVDEEPLLDELEEGRVYYVGATRARQLLWVAGSARMRASYLESGRVFRFLGRNRTQLEVGREPDVDLKAHLAWSNAREIQQVLASAVGRQLTAFAEAKPELDYVSRLHAEYDGKYQGVGQMSLSFKYELYELWRRLSFSSSVRPASQIQNLYVIGARTVALSDSELAGASPPFSQSGFALAPIVKGFPMIPFFRRRGG